MDRHLILYLPVIGLLLFSACQRTDETDYGEYFNNLPFEMSAIQAPQFPRLEVSITDFLDENGNSLSSIQKAIDSVNEKGGGTVVIPAGSWLSDPFELKSNVCLRCEKGSIVQFTDDYDHYPLIETYYEGRLGWRVMSPVTAHDAENIAIMGEGIFDGNGQAWRPVRKSGVNIYRWNEFCHKPGVLNEQEDTWYPTERALLGSQQKSTSTLSYEECLAIKEYLRPVMVNLLSCHNVLIQGVTFRNSPAWCLHPVLCENLILDGVFMMNEEWAANGDGLDLESCRNVLVKDCFLDAGDDAICLKSGKDEEGRRRGVPTENVVIDSCKVYKGHGGFVIGSEMSGGVRNVKISNCTFLSTDNGLRFKSVRGRGGVVENIWVDNIHMAAIKSDAILFDLYYFSKGPKEFKPVDEGTPEFRNIYMDHIDCVSAGQVGIMQGLPELHLHNVYLSNSTLRGVQSLTMNDTKDIWFDNVCLYSEADTLIIGKKTDISRVLSIQTIIPDNR